MRLEETGAFVAQDAYVNATLTDSDGAVLAYADALRMEASQPASVTVNNTLYYMNYNIDGAPSDHQGVLDGIFGLPYAWMHLTDQGPQSGGMISLLADGSAQSGFVTAEHVRAYLDAMGDGLTLQAAVVALQAVAPATGVTVRDAGLSDWVTVQLGHGGFVTLELGGDRVFTGALDQIILDAGQEQGTPNAGLDGTIFLDPVAFVGQDGLVFHGWNTTAEERAQNTAPDLQLADQFMAEDGRIDLLDLLDFSDADGDAAVYAQISAGPGPAVLFEADGTAFDGTSVILRVDALSDWYVTETGNGSVTVRLSDSQTWSQTLNLTESNVAFDAPQATQAIDADGNRIDALFDYTEQYWSRFSETRNNADQLIRSEMLKDNGDVIRNQFDAFEEHNWWVVETYYVDGTDLERQKWTDDTGSQFRIIYDLDQSSVWTEHHTEHTADGVLQTATFLYDRGGHLQIDYAPNGPSDWVERHSRHDAEGAVEEILLRYGDGSEQRTVYDTTDAYDWQSVDRLYDADGALVQAIETPDLV